MSCVKPWVRIPNEQINTKTGKHCGNIRALSDLISWDGKYHDFYEWRDNYVNTHPDIIQFGLPVLIPCGECVGCRLQKSRDWANRCMLELSDHKSAFFLTLTYDDNHLFDKNGNPWDNNPYCEPSVLKDHVRQFIRKLRDNGQNIRYFACGEYGDNTLRPHYHIIVFGLEIPDLKFYKKSGLNDIYYTSEYINSFWCSNIKSDPEPYGYVIIGQVTWETCAYTARYCMKKINGTKIWELYKSLNINPEFVLMSTHPGIAHSYLDRAGPGILESSSIPISTKNGGRKIGVPRYFKRLCSDTYCEYVDYITRQAEEDAMNGLISSFNKTSLSHIDYLHNQEDVIKNKVKCLRRKEF